MGRQHLPVTKSAMMSPVLFLLPILLCVAQAEPSGKYFLIDTVDDEESDGGADYFDRDLMIKMLEELLKVNGGAKCGSVLCLPQNSNKKKNWNDYMTFNNKLSQIGTQTQIDKQT